MVNFDTPPSPNHKLFLYECESERPPSLTQAITLCRLCDSNYIRPISRQLYCALNHLKLRNQNGSIPVKDHFDLSTYPFPYT